MVSKPVGNGLRAVPLCIYVFGTTHRSFPTDVMTKRDGLLCVQIVIK